MTNRYRVKPVVGGGAPTWLKNGVEYDGEQVVEEPRRLKPRIRLFNPANTTEWFDVPASWVQQVDPPTGQ